MNHRDATLVIFDYRVLVDAARAEREATAPQTESSQEPMFPWTEPRELE